MKQMSIVLLIGIVFVLFSSSASGMYCPQTGRFLQRDPLGTDPAGGKENLFGPTYQYSGGMNLYEYVGSLPTMQLDAFGLHHNFGRLFPVRPGDILPPPRPTPPPPPPLPDPTEWRPCDDNHWAVQNEELPSENGCGPQDGFPVPDSVIVWSSVNPRYATGFFVSFTNACNIHDRCYQQCGITQEECDGQFRNDLRAECDRQLRNRSSTALRQCYHLADIYTTAVRTWGTEPYRDGQEYSCDCVPVEDIQCYLDPFRGRT